MNYQRFGEFDLSIIGKIIEAKRKGKKQIIVNGMIVRTGSDRYENFFYNGFVCEKCGLKGVKACLEQEKGVKSRKAHFNIYGYDIKGKEVMLTLDHIFPKSLGGNNSMLNAQTLCQKCNVKKSNHTNITFKKAEELKMI